MYTKYLTFLSEKKPWSLQNLTANKDFCIDFKSDFNIYNSRQKVWENKKKQNSLAISISKKLCQLVLLNIFSASIFYEWSIYLL